MTKTAQDNKISFPGVVLTVVATVGFVWGGMQWYNRYNWPTKFSVDEIRSNEVSTFENLKLVVQAQEQYRERDWDADGKKNYAGFIVHLWTSIDTQSEPILVDIISKELAFAMGPGEAKDGYYFEDLRSRGLEGQFAGRELDIAKEWAVAGIPAAYGNTGFLMFLADNSGRIFARADRDIPQLYPNNPLSEGWFEIATVEQLSNLQNTVIYEKQ